MRETISTCELQNELNALSGLPETEATWHRFDNLLQRILSLEPHAAAQALDLALRCALSERTKLSGTALNAIKHLSTHENYFIFIPTVLKVLNRPNKVFYMRASDCLEHFALFFKKSDTSFVMNYFRDALTSLNKNVRISVFSMLEKYCRLKDVFSDLEKYFEAGAKDSHPEVRVICRRTIEFCKNSLQTSAPLSKSCESDALAQNYETKIELSNEKSEVAPLESPGQTQSLFKKFNFEEKLFKKKTKSKKGRITFKSFLKGSKIKNSRTDIVKSTSDQHLQLAEHLNADQEDRNNSKTKLPYRKLLKLKNNDDIQDLTLDDILEAISVDKGTHKPDHKAVECEKSVEDAFSSLLITDNPKFTATSINKPLGNDKNTSSYLKEVTNVSYDRYITPIKAQVGNELSHILPEKLKNNHHVAIDPQKNQLNSQMNKYMHFSSSKNPCEPIKYTLQPEREAKSTEKSLEKFLEKSEAKICDDSNIKESKFVNLPCKYKSKKESMLLSSKYANIFTKMTVNTQSSDKRHHDVVDETKEIHIAPLKDPKKTVQQITKQEMVMKAITEDRILKNIAKFKKIARTNPDLFYKEENRCFSQEMPGKTCDNSLNQHQTNEELLNDYLQSPNADNSNLIRINRIFPAMTSDSTVKSLDKVSQVTQPQILVENHIYYKENEEDMIKSKALAQDFVEVCNKYEVTTVNTSPKALSSYQKCCDKSKEFEAVKNSKDSELHKERELNCTNPDQNDFLDQDCVVSLHEKTAPGNDTNTSSTTFTRTKKSVLRDQKAFNMKLEAKLQKIKDLYIKMSNKASQGDKKLLNIDPISFKDTNNVESPITRDSQSIMHSGFKDISNQNSHVPNVKVPSHEYNISYNEPASSENPSHIMITNSHANPLENAITSTCCENVKAKDDKSALQPPMHAEFIHNSPLIESIQEFQLKRANFIEKHFEHILYNNILAANRPTMEPAHNQISEIKDISTVQQSVSSELQDNQGNSNEKSHVDLSKNSTTKLTDQESIAQDTVQTILLPQNDGIFNAQNSSFENVLCDDNFFSPQNLQKDLDFHDMSNVEISFAEVEDSKVSINDVAQDIHELNNGQFVVFPVSQILEKEIALTNNLDNRKNDKSEKNYLDQSDSTILKNKEQPTLSCSSHDILSNIQDCTGVTWPIIMENPERSNKTTSNNSENGDIEIRISETNLKISENTQSYMESRSKNTETAHLDVFVEFEEDQKDANKEEYSLFKSEKPHNISFSKDLTNMLAPCKNLIHSENLSLLHNPYVERVKDENINRTHVFSFSKNGRIQGSFLEDESNIQEIGYSFTKPEKSDDLHPLINHDKNKELPQEIQADSHDMRFSQLNNQIFNTSREAKQNFHLSAKIDTTKISVNDVEHASCKKECDSEGKNCVKVDPNATKIFFSENISHDTDEIDMNLSEEINKSFEKWNLSDDNTYDVPTRTKTDEIFLGCDSFRIENECTRDLNKTHVFGKEFLEYSLTSSQEKTSMAGFDLSKPTHQLKNEEVYDSDTILFKELSLKPNDCEKTVQSDLEHTKTVSYSSQKHDDKGDLRSNVYDTTSQEDKISSNAYVEKGERFDRCTHSENTAPAPLFCLNQDNNVVKILSESNEEIKESHVDFSLPYKAFSQEICLLNTPFIKLQDDNSSKDKKLYRGQESNVSDSTAEICSMSVVFSEKNHIDNIRNSSITSDISISHRYRSQDDDMSDRATIETQGTSSILKNAHAFQIEEENLKNSQDFILKSGQNCNGHHCDSQDPLLRSKAVQIINKNLVSMPKQPIFMRTDTENLNIHQFENTLLSKTALGQNSDTNLTSALPKETCASIGLKNNRYVGLIPSETSSDTEISHASSQTPENEFFVPEPLESITIISKKGESTSESGKYAAHMDLVMSEKPSIFYLEATKNMSSDMELILSGQRVQSPERVFLSDVELTNDINHRSIEIFSDENTEIGIQEIDVKSQVFTDVGNTLTLAKPKPHKQDLYKESILPENAHVELEHVSMSHSKAPNEAESKLQAKPSVLSFYQRLYETGAKKNRSHVIPKEKTFCKSLECKFSSVSRDSHRRFFKSTEDNAFREQGKTDLPESKTVRMSSRIYGRPNCSTTNNKHINSVNCNKSNLINKINLNRNSRGIKKLITNPSHNDSRPDNELTRAVEKKENRSSDFFDRLYTEGMKKIRPRPNIVTNTASKSTTNSSCLTYSPCTKLRKTHNLKMASTSNTFEAKTGICEIQILETNKKSQMSSRARRRNVDPKYDVKNIFKKH